jgi:iron complex outermembrane recepter protein
MSTKHRIRVSTDGLALAGACAGLLLSTTAAVAQQQQQSGGVLEEIVVTATRHEESLSKVPISVTALSQETLDLKGIKDFQDIVRFTPGVTIDSSGTNAISIRGISSSGGAGTTGIYIDDTPIQMRALGFNPDDTLPKTFDLERVEVLRGPQGTLFGSGSEGGTVRYIMTQPSLTKESTYARAEVGFTRGGEPSYEAGVAHGGPLVDGVVGFRASVWGRYDGGWIDRVDPTTGALVDQRSNRANTLAARLAFVVQPKEGFTITPAMMYQNSRKHDESTYWQAYSNVGAGQFNSGNPEREPVPDEYWLASLKIEADLGHAKLISNTSYYHRNEITAYQGTVYDLAYFQSLSWPPANPTAYQVDACGPASTSATPPCSWYPLIDGSGIHLPPGFTNFATPNSVTNQQRTWTQEVRLQSNDDASPWRWTVGAFWSLSREVSIEELRDSTGQMVAFWNDIFGVDPTSFYGPYYNCPISTVPASNTPGQTFPDCDIYYNGNQTHDRQLAGFGEATYSVTDRFKITAGGRWAKMSFDLNHYADGLLNFGPGRATASQSETSFTPKLNLSFQADPNDLYYFTYAKGFRPGGGNAPLPSYCDGFNGLAQTGYPNGAPLTYKSDSTQSFEVGAKNNVSGRFKIASSVYWIKWNDIQQSVYVPYGCGLQFTDNLGTAVAKGFDVQAEMVLGGGFSLDAAVGYTSARYTKSTVLKGVVLDANGNPVNVPVILANAGDAISGEAAIDGSPGTNPPWTASVGLQYNWTAGGHDAFARFDWEYMSRNNWLATTQDPVTTQFDPFTYALSATTFGSLRGGVTFGSLQLALFIDNVFDSRTTTNYQLSQVDGSNPNGSQSVQQNAYTYRPRTIGITATYRN